MKASKTTSLEDLDAEWARTNVPTRMGPQCRMCKDKQLPRLRALVAAVVAAGAQQVQAVAIRERLGQEEPAFLERVSALSIQRHLRTHEPAWAAFKKGESK